jgi:hypothetical protein
VPIVRPLHEAIADVHDVPSRRRFGKLYCIETGETTHVTAKRGPLHPPFKELSQIAPGKRLFDPLQGFDDLYVDGMQDASYQPRPAEAPRPFGVAVHSSDLNDRLIDAAA